MLPKTCLKALGGLEGVPAQGLFRTAKAETELSGIS